jgi:hypothetical protein
MGVVDATKAFWGGPSNFGFGHIKNALTPFLSPLGVDSPAFGSADVLHTLKANWLSGVAKADQKAKAKSLIHLGLTEGRAPALAAAAGVDPGKLESLAQKTAAGKKVTQDEMNVLGQFDVVLSAVLDEAYERGDQKYRNASKFLAMGVSTIMGAVGGWIVFGDGTTSYFTSSNFPLCARDLRLVFCELRLLDQRQSCSDKHFRQHDPIEFGFRAHLEGEIFPDFSQPAQIQLRNHVFCCPANLADGAVYSNGAYRSFQLRHISLDVLPGDIRSYRSIHAQNAAPL